MMTPLPPGSTLFPYTTLFRSEGEAVAELLPRVAEAGADDAEEDVEWDIDARLRGDIDADDGRLHFRRSEEHTSELQSHVKLVCRLLLEKKNRRSPRDA